MNDQQHGIIRLVRSSKFYTAVVGTVLALLPILFAGTDLTREQKLAQWRNFVLAASGLWGGVIVMNGVEDYAAKRDVPAGVGSTPSVQVNTGSDAANVQSSAPSPRGPAIVLPPETPAWTSSTVPKDAPKP